MNKYIVFFSLFGIESILCKQKSERFKKKNSKINKFFLKKNLTINLDKVIEELKSSSQNSFFQDCKLLIAKFMQSAFFNKELSNFKNKKNYDFLKTNKDIAKISSDFKINETPEVKISVPLVPLTESFLNINNNEFEIEFFNGINNSFSEFLNKAYELRVKKWLLLNVEADINFCYSALSKLKNSSDFIELNEKIDNLFEEINDLKQDISALEEEMESRWNIEKSFWCSANLFSSFDFVFSFLQEDMDFALKNLKVSFKKDKKIDLSFLSVDFNLKVYPEVKPSFSISIKPLNLIFGNDFKKKDCLDESLKNNFEISKIRRKIKINIRKTSQIIKKNRFLKQKTSRMIDYDKKNIEDKLKYIEQSIKCCYSFILLFEQIVLYKKINNDLILDCKMLLGEEE